MYSEILFSQSKIIQGDTISFHNRNISLQKSLKVKDFEKSYEEFNFRLITYRQIVEVSKDSSYYSATITNFIYHSKKSNKNNKDTLFKKVFLDSDQAKAICNIVQSSTLMDLRSAKNIENWDGFCDGDSYSIEYSDKNYYWIKNYSNPGLQDSIPEAMIVSNLINSLTDTLKLNDLYSEFKSSLPERGCYSNGGMVVHCYYNSGLSVGYSGSTKLPFGIYSLYFTEFIGETKLNVAAIIQYNFDYNGFQHLNLGLSKGETFFKNSNFRDVIDYRYQNRSVNIADVKYKFENHRIIYTLFKKKIGIGSGLDYLSGNYAKLGPHFFVNKWFYHNINTTISASVFDNQVNFNVGVAKWIRIDSRHSSGISIGLSYEDFMDYKDFYFFVKTTLY
jgi:hypothetical protein